MIDQRKTSSQFLRAPPAVGASSRFWAPLLGLLILLGADFYLFPHLFPLPALLLVFLLFLSFRLPARNVAIWGVIYGALVLIIRLLQPEELYVNPVFSPYTRTATFCVGCLGAVFVARQRQGLDQSHQSLLSVLGALPMSVLVSDSTGNFLFINDAARELLGN